MSKLAINAQLSLDLAPGTRIARMAGISELAALRAIGAEIAARLNRAGPLAEWPERHLDLSNPNARTETDELFVSYRQLCEAAGVPAEGRLSHRAFGAALTDLGFKIEYAPGGLEMRLGCKLKRRAMVLPVLDEEAPVEGFLAARCHVLERGSKARVRAQALHEAYTAWALEGDRDAIGIKRFASQMGLLGFRRVRSNGIWWSRLRLLPAQASPRPLGLDHVSSEAGAGSDAVLGLGR